jgi:hypothetical protein
MVSVLTRRGLRSPYQERNLPDGRRVFWKCVKPEHEVITPPGVAVVERVLDEGERRGFAGVVVLRVRTGEELWSPLSRWRRGIPLRRGFGPQRELVWNQLESLPGADQQISLFHSFSTEQVP